MALILTPPPHMLSMCDDSKLTTRGPFWALVLSVLGPVWLLCPARLLLTSIGMCIAGIDASYQLVARIISITTEERSFDQ
jgi:hypothetical protein